MKKINVIYERIFCHESVNNAADKSVLNIPHNCVVSTVIPETVKPNNSLEDCVNQTFLN
jgi:hypothetical protein